jgi:putative two-component system response regulator
MKQGRDKRGSILVVDDVDINRTILAAILDDEYKIFEAANGIEALKVLAGMDPLPEAVLLDFMMPEMDGLETLRRIKMNPATMMIPVLVLTTLEGGENESKCLNEGAVDYIQKPFNSDVVKARVHNHIELKQYRDNLEAMLEAKTAELERTTERTMETLANIIEYRSLESGEHIQRTATLTRILVDYLIDRKEYQAALLELKPRAIVKAVPMHDIGKIGINDAILLKPGRLTPEEFGVMKGHTTIGSEIIKTIQRGVDDTNGYLARAYEICRWHHERWDGTGYPDNKKGEDIPLTARIVAVVDVYDALVSVRCYKSAFTHEDAMLIIEKGSGTQFDPVIIDAFTQIQDKIRAIYTMAEVVHA